MKLVRTTALSAAAALLCISSFAHAQTSQLSTETPAVVELQKSLDSAKLTSGAKVEAKLVHTVKLPNGTQIPSGSWLVATVGQDDLQLNGKTKLALRFNEARLKDGKTIPVKATILAASTDFVAVQNDPSSVEVVMDVPDNLEGQPDQIDDAGVSRDVDLHSRASSANSGVFVTTRDDIKLPDGTKMELALAPGA